MPGTCMVSLNQLLATKSPGELSALAERLDYMADAKVVGPLKAAAVTTKGGAGAKAAAAGSAAKSAAVGADATGSKAGLAAGSIWSGKRFGLDLGLGLGPWGPILLGAAGLAAIYGLVRMRRAREASDESLLVEALMARYPDFDWQKFLTTDSPLDLRAYLEERGIIPGTGT